MRGMGGERAKPIPPPAGVLGAGLSSSHDRPGGLPKSPGGWPVGAGVPPRQLGGCVAPPASSHLLWGAARTGASNNRGAQGGREGVGGKKQELGGRNPDTLSLHSSSQLAL